MSRDNVEIVHAILAAWEQGDFRTPLDLLDPEISFETFMPDADRNVAAHGLAQLAAFSRDWLAQWQQYRITADEVREVSPGRVFASLRQLATGQHSGAAVESPGFAVWTLRGGKVVALSLHLDRERALDALAPPETVASAREVMDAIGRRDADRLVALSHPDVEWHSFFAVGQEGGMYRGHDGAGQYMRDLTDAWEVGRADVDDALGVGDVAVLVGRIHYRGRGSGVETETPAGWVLKFREGRLIRFRAFREPEQALEAVGLRE